MHSIDFPVSQTWAEYYREKGFSVDPSCVRIEERRIRPIYQERNNELDEKVAEAIMVLQEFINALQNRRQVKDAERGSVLWRLKS